LCYGPSGHSYTLGANHATLEPLHSKAEPLAAPALYRSRLARHASQGPPLVRIGVVGVKVSYIVGIDNLPHDERLYGELQALLTYRIRAALETHVPGATLTVDRHFILPTAEEQRAYAEYLRSLEHDL
jgi:hypothetical protein